MPRISVKISSDPRPGRKRTLQYQRYMFFKRFSISSMFCIEHSRWLDIERGYEDPTGGENKTIRGYSKFDYTIF